MITYFKELFSLIKMLFSSKPSDFESLELLHMNHFPFSGYKYMSWCGRMIYKDEDKVNDLIENDSYEWKRSKNHEGIHLRRSKDYKSWLGYYSNYVWEWIKGNPIIHPSSSAYYTNPHEMEAYANQDNFEYINTCTKDDFNRYKIKDRKKTYKQYRYNWLEYLKTI